MIKVLQASKTLPIARAQMRVRITMASKEGKRLKEKILPLITKVEDDEWSDEWELVESLPQSTFQLVAADTGTNVVVFFFLLGRINRSWVVPSH